MRIKSFVPLLVAAFVAGSAHAATLSYTGGALSLQIATLPGLLASGSGTVSAGTALGHLNSMVLASAALGPVTASVPVTNSSTINSVIFTGVGNLTGNFTGISGGPPGGGPMGISGLAKICLVFGPCGTSNVPVPLSPVGGKGIGVGGTQTFPGNVNITMKHAPWTIGQPVLTIHSPNSNVTTPVLPGGFVHGPASLTSSTALPSGTIQLVTVSKTYTSLASAFPELPVIGVLQLHFVPEPGTLLLLVSGVVGLAVLGRKRNR
jgi:hypothetical protein